MSRNRIISASSTRAKCIEAFPYSMADFGQPLDLEASEGEDDQPVAASLSTPAEDAQRLASTDQIIQSRLQQAEQEAQEIARKAYEEGFAAGEAEGRSFGATQYRAYIQQLGTHLQELTHQGSLLAQTSEEEVLALSLAFGEYLAGQQIEISPEAIRPLLTSVLATHPLATSGGGENLLLHIHLNPEDLDQLQPPSIDYPGLMLHPDETLSRGSLRLETPEGVLEATLERRRSRLLQLIERLQAEETP